MPTTATYQYVYAVDPISVDNGAQTVTLGSAFPTTYQVSDIGDGAVNGVVPLGSDVVITQSGNTFTVLAWSQDSVLLRYEGGTGFPEYYLLSNNPSLPTNISLDAVNAYVLPCYLAGTFIATPDGDRRVESLVIGDRVTTRDGREVSVRWVGHRSVSPFAARMAGALPVRIRAGALGENTPASNLYVSPDHAMWVDGLLVHAGALVNGTSIVQLTTADVNAVRYYHVETAEHEIILANGAPAETFIDNVSRETFDNYAEFAALYPGAPAMRELDLPRVKYRRQLPRRIAERIDAVAETLAVESVECVA